MSGSRRLYLRAAMILLLMGKLSRPTACGAGEPTARWIVVTAPAFRDAIEPLRVYRAAQGLETSVVKVSDLLGDGPPKRGGAKKIREYLVDLCGKSPAKTYVLLVGAAVGVDPKQPQETQVPILPGTIGRMKNQPSDNGYGCAGDELMPSVAVGRLPARNAAEASVMVEKILAYEQRTRKQRWGRTLTLLVGDPGGATAAQKAVFNRYVNNAVQTSFGQINPLWHVQSICHFPESPWYVPDGELHDRALGYLEAGQAFSFYLGHSNDAGFWSANARFIDRADWANMSLPHGAGVFITCGCYACQFDPAGREEQEGFGLAAIRSRTGPAAVLGATAEGYSAGGQLAFNGILPDFAHAALPERLGELWLHLKAGLANGPIDFVTFTMFDYGDGSNGKIPLDVQRQEHLEMWILLGDPAMRLPDVRPTIALEAPASAPAGARIVIHGSAAAGQSVHVTIERPASSTPAGLIDLPATPGPARDAVILANHQKANDPVLVSTNVPVVGGRFEAEMDMPGKVAWAKVIVRASSAVDGEESEGVAEVRVERSATTQPSPVRGDINRGER